MSGIGTTAANLVALRGRWRSQVERQMAQFGGTPNSEGTRLRQVTEFGSNPGRLEMFTFSPEQVAAFPALVVVLHGCTQTASGYDLGAGWSTLAERHGFFVLYPQQTMTNNPKTCFNWFVPSDTVRDQGEALSIRQMIERAVVDHGIDRSRIFITGLSAGGAMTATMLAAYPEIFAGGGIVAGLPHGSAQNVQQALSAMHEARSRPAQEWGDLVRTASSHTGAWPRLSIWHGTSDPVVKATNAVELVKQWTELHGVADQDGRRSLVDGHVREVWSDPAGREVVESFTIAGMGHGTPLRTGNHDGMCGAAGPFLLDVGISSSWRMASFWGLTEGSARRVSRPRREASAQDSVGRPSAEQAETVRFPQGKLGPISKVIDDALRAAGLMRR